MFWEVGVVFVRMLGYSEIATFRYP